MLARNSPDVRVIRLLVVAFSACVCLSGCTFNAWNKDFVTPSAKLNPPKFNLLSLGMTKQQVESALGQPDQFSSAKRVGGRTVEAWEYIRVEARPGPDRIGERYQVEFTDGKLSGYESAGDFKQQVNVR
jgi:hypothetical protein